MIHTIILSSFHPLKVDVTFKITIRFGWIIIEF
jgi:hypothetical protein